MLFNHDMDARLADLHDAATAGAEIAVRRVAGGDYHQGQMPDRVALRFGAREVVFEPLMALQLADQMEANSFPDLAARIREVC